MAATQSTMLALGTHAPDFALPEVASGNLVALHDFAGKDALLVIFLCAHCPYVVHVAPELARIANDYAGRSVGIVGITSNDITQYPQDAPEPTARFAKDAGLNFPVLYDESQRVARAFSAACTPDFFLFDGALRLVYRGQIDASRPYRAPDRPGGGELNGADLRTALDAVLAGKPVAETQRPSIGCNIKWKTEDTPSPSR